MTSGGLSEVTSYLVVNVAASSAQSHDVSDLETQASDRKRKQTTPDGVSGSPHEAWGTPDGASASAHRLLVEPIHDVIADRNQFAVASTTPPRGSTQRARQPADLASVTAVGTDETV